MCKKSVPKVSTNETVLKTILNVLNAHPECTPSTAHYCTITWPSLYHIPVIFCFFLLKIKLWEKYNRYSLLRPQVLYIIVGTFETLSQKMFWSRDHVIMTSSKGILFMSWSIHLHCLWRSRRKHLIKFYVNRYSQYVPPDVVFGPTQPKWH